MMIEILNKILIAFLLLVPNAYLFLVFYRFRKNLRELIAPSIFLLLLTVVFLNKLIFRDQTLAAQDFNNIQIPFFHFFRESVISYQEPPFWNSRFGGGFDAFSNPISAYFSPFNIIFLLFENVYTAANLFIFIQIFLISIFSLLLFRELKFNIATCIFGAVVFTFNGFVTMRLSPGVGIEYLYSYKWIPLILFLTLLYFRERRTYDLTLISIPLAFTLEGNLNIVIAIWAFWGVFVLTIIRKPLMGEIKKLIIVPLLVFIIYAIKILPFIDLMGSSTGRISGVVKGWRLDKIEPGEFLTYFLPIKKLFGSAVFTPGVVASVFFLVCVVVVIVSLIKKRKVDRVLGFSLLSVFIGFLLTTYNPLSNFLFSLPYFNRITVVPALMVFILIPTYIMTVYGLNMTLAFIYKRVPLFRINLIRDLAVIGLACLVFIEILLGPSTFGYNTYSFNFAKMDKSEVTNIPPYSDLEKLEPGIFVFLDSSDIFLYPYAVVVSDLYTMNNFRYFYGPVTEDRVIKDGGLSEVKKRSNYVISTKPIEDDGLDYIFRTGTADIFGKFESFSIQDKKYSYLDLQSENKWDERMYIYGVNNNQETSYYKRIENHPTGFVIKDVDSYLENGYIRTTVKYSRWWQYFGDGSVTIESDSYGFMNIFGVENLENLRFQYCNPYIYTGMAISLFGFGIYVYTTLSNYRHSDPKVAKIKNKK